jgi:hypothetical protein
MGFCRASVVRTERPVCGADRRFLAISSFLFRDSVLTSAGELIRSHGSTTFIWERRKGEWRVRFGDADHYPTVPETGGA